MTTYNTVMKKRNANNDGWDNILPITTVENIVNMPESFPANGGNANTVGGKSASDFAPAGFGLGGAAKHVSGDVNDLVNTGWYMGQGMTNSPSGTWWFLFEVIRHNSDWIYQKAIHFTNANYPTYERLNANGVWGAWREVPRGSTSSNHTLASGTWAGTSAPFTYTLSVTGVTTTNVVEVIPQSNLTVDQQKAMADAMIATGTQSAGSIVLRAFGKKPTINLPITVIVRGDL